MVRAMFQAVACAASLAATLALAAALGACGRSEGVSDQQLGGLVIAPKVKAAPIDVAKAARDPVELSRALARPYRETVTALGPHTYNLSTTMTVQEAGTNVEELSDHTTIELGDKGTYHAVYTNSADYGREVIYDGTKLYLRPRYQRWHGRAPESPEEPTQVRDSFFEAIAATWDLLAPGAELTDLGPAQVAGHAGKKIAVKLAPSPRKPAAEPLSQRKWREARVIEAVSGEVVLDVDKGAPLSIKLSGTVVFTRDGHRFQMKVSIEGTTSAIGQPVAVALPAGDTVVATPERLREVDDRDFLLQGIAPPLRKVPDGAAVVPDPAPSPDRGSAAKPPAGAANGSASNRDSAAGATK